MRRGSSLGRLRRVPRRLYPGRCCRVCGRFVYLNRRGEYRRHLTTIDGRTRLCPATGHDALTEQRARAARWLRISYLSDRLRWRSQTLA
jgi:hypothetical protein